MSSIWTFSTSSEPCLRRFIAAVPPPDLNNKWFIKFGNKILSDTTEAKENTTINTIIDSSHERNVTVSYEDFFDRISSESTISAEYILQQCYMNPALVPQTAERLTTNSVKQLFVHIFSKDDAEVPSKFIINFLVHYIKVQYSRECIDLLIKTNERYPALFKELIEALINDTDVPAMVLSDYISGLNEDTSTEFMKMISTVETSAEGFTRNVFAVYAAYKDCTKDDVIQNYIQKMITLHGDTCTSDKSFGRLLLTFLQSEKALNRKVSDTIQRCVHQHMSVLKRSCVLLLEDITNK